MKPANKERGTMRASKSAKISLCPTQRILTTKPDSAVTVPHSGDWLLAFALPISSCGLRLDVEAVRVSVGLRLGCKIGEPHECVCGSLVDTMGSHALLQTRFWTPCSSSFCERPDTPCLWPVLTFRSSRSRKGYSRQTTKDQMATLPFFGTPAGT